MNNTIRLTDPAVIITGIRQFGLAPDGSDLRDLEAAIERLRSDKGHDARETAARSLHLAAESIARAYRGYLPDIETPDIRTRLALIEDEMKRADRALTALLAAPGSVIADVGATESK